MDAHISGDKHLYNVISCYFWSTKRFLTNQPDRVGWTPILFQVESFLMITKPTPWLAPWSMLAFYENEVLILNIKDLLIIFKQKKS